MLFYIMSDHSEILRVIRHYRHLDLGNCPNKFGNHCVKGTISVTEADLKASTLHSIREAYKRATKLPVHCLP